MFTRRVFIIKLFMSWKKRMCVWWCADDLYSSLEYRVESFSSGKILLFTFRSHVVICCELCFVAVQRTTSKHRLQMLAKNLPHRKLRTTYRVPEIFFDKNFFANFLLAWWSINQVLYSLEDFSPRFVAWITVFFYSLLIRLHEYIFCVIFSSPSWSLRFYMRRR